MRPGDVVHIAAEDRRYADESVTLRITRVREDLSRYYDDEWVWLEGMVLLRGGGEGTPTQVLARTSALQQGSRR